MTDEALGIVKTNRLGPAVPRPSTKRQAPSPPGMVNGGPRRLVTNDRDTLRPVTRVPSQRNGFSKQIAVGNNRRGSSVDGLDSSFSESEAIHGEAEKVSKSFNIICVPPINKQTNIFPKLIFFGSNFIIYHTN